MQLRLPPWPHPSRAANGAWPLQPMILFLEPKRRNIIQVSSKKKSNSIYMATPGPQKLLVIVRIKDVVKSVTPINSRQTARCIEAWEDVVLIKSSFSNNCFQSRWTPHMQFRTTVTITHVKLLKTHRVIGQIGWIFCWYQFYETLCLCSEMLTSFLRLET